MPSLPLMQALAARWEVFRNAVVQAYGSNSLAWPEEIKYTYAVCFNRILGVCRCNLGQLCLDDLTVFPII